MLFQAKPFQFVDIFAASMILAAGLAISVPAKATVFSFDVINYSAANGGFSDGGAGLPNYCFRTDKLLGIGNTVTFSCEGTGTGVQLDYDDNNTAANSADDTIHIFGTVFGGSDTGSAYDPNNSGFAVIDFLYTSNIAVGTGVDLTVNPEDHAANTGTLTFGNDASWAASVQNQIVALEDEDGGKGFSFKFNNFTDQKGTPSTLSTDSDLYHGQGWMNYDADRDGDPDLHVSATDWLFIATPQIDEPGTLAVFGLGLVGLGIIRRRRRFI